MLRKALLVCGIVSSLLYVGTDVLAAMRYGDYHSYTSRAISELYAIGAPTKQLIDPLFFTYSVLLMAFAVGVWISPGRKLALHLVGGLLIGIAVVGLVTGLFFPMKLRGTSDVSGDAPHIALTAVSVLFILLAVGFGSSLYGRRFRLYSFATLLILVVFGAWAGFEGARLAAQQPTPWLGLTERINIGAYLLWVLVLAITLLRSTELRQELARPTQGRVATDNVYDA
jgi:hypothetical protein